jgi:hypothetical protein
MSILIQGSVGPQAKAAGDGTPIELRAGRTGELAVVELHGRYFEAMRVGLMFSAANQAAQAVSVALTTTYTGILLYNPVGSGKILVPNKWKYALSVAPGAISVLGLLQGYSATGGVTAQTTKLTTLSNQIGNSGVGVGIALSAATITTPTVLAALWDGFTASSLPNPTVPVDLEGAVGILPGGYVGIYALTAVTGIGSVFWEEIDLIGGGT